MRYHADVHNWIFTIPWLCVVCEGTQVTVLLADPLEGELTVALHFRCERLWLSLA